MFEMAKKDDVFCALLSEAEWSLYLHFNWRMHDEMVARYPEVANQENYASIEEKARDIFFDKKCRAFGLFKGGEMIGYTHLQRENDTDATLVGSFILEAHRRQGYSSLLYEARQKYVYDYTNCTRISTEIWHENEASQKAALRNGYVRSAREAKNGPEYWIYERIIERKPTVGIHLPPSLEIGEPS